MNKVVQMIEGAISKTIECVVNGFKGVLYNWHHDEWTAEWNYSMRVMDPEGQEVLHAYNATPKNADDLKKVVEQVGGKYVDIDL